MSEDRLEEIKKGKPANPTEFQFSSDVAWLISEVERLRRECSHVGILRAQRDHNRMMAEKDATIATLRKPIDIARKAQACKDCVVGAFCGKHDDLFWGAMREALATAKEDE